jgi:molybdopterin synthase catalytic subunit/molybdopterin converting factor small subunit
MKVRVLMFGALADAAAKQDDFDLPEPVTAADVTACVRERYPDAGGIIERCCVAVDHDVVDAAHPISSGAEVALLPPMSGGGVHVALSDMPSVARAVDTVHAAAAGGTAVFVGTVRGSCDRGQVERLEYTVYGGMAEKVIGEIAREAADKWTLEAVAVEHAVGSRLPGDVTFVVACAAAHRDAAFDACRYVVDEVKARAPIWKKETGEWGERWLGL